jgi:hypothetical protein
MVSSRQFARVWGAAVVVAALLVCGCSKSPNLDAQAQKSFDALRKSVRSETGDPARADSIAARIDTLEHRSLALIREVRAENDLLIRMYADRSVEDTTLLARFRDDERYRATLRSSLLEARAQLRSVASPAEWAILSKAETKAMSQVAAMTHAR